MKRLLTITTLALGLGPMAVLPAHAITPLATHAVAHRSAFHQVGVASYYGKGFAGRKTASGEVFNPNHMTAAHKTLPFGTVVRVTRLDNGKSVKVVINDRGPYVGGRIIDLSAAAGKRLGLDRSGTAKVRIDKL